MGETFGVLDFSLWLDDTVRQYFVSNPEARGNQRLRKTLIADAVNVTLANVGRRALLEWLLEDEELHMYTCAKLSEDPERSVHIPYTDQRPDDHAAHFKLVDYIRMTIRPWALEQARALWEHYERTNP